MSDFSDFADRLRSFRKSWKEGTKEVTQDAVRRMHQHVTQQLNDNDSVATATLINEIAYEEDPSVGDALIVASVEAPNWAKYVEYGTGPRGREDRVRNHEQYPKPSSPPPLANIEQWVFAKNIQPTEYDSQYELARAIQQTIAEKGQYPHPFMRPIWFDRNVGYESVVTDAHTELKEQLRRL